MPIGETKIRRISISKDRAIVLFLLSLAFLVGFGFFTEVPKTGDNPKITIGSNEYDFPACPFRTISGIPCPFCGLARASYLIMHGDPAGSFRANPLGILLAASAIFCLLIMPYFIFRKEPKPGNSKAKVGKADQLVSNRNGIILLTVLAIVWIINLARYFNLIRW
ncbi:MAG: DUF2752 domain-containing protein [bacterium]